jgi:maltooligosyltrehalose trehalohydrolase
VNPTSNSRFTFRVSRFAFRDDKAYSMTKPDQWELPIGAQPDAAGTRFRVWAANAQRVEVVLSTDGRPAAVHTLAPDGDGYFAAFVAGVRPGAHYMYRLDGGDPRPDPASRYQPTGVHGPSQVIDPAFRWNDGDWRGSTLEELVIYELHVGAATPVGTFDALIERLDDIRALGATAIELMPVADFPGERGWGYDGVCLFAPARTYGDPDALRRLVDAAHAHGLAVLLDVVYNHLGPDGNYLRQFSADYFTSRHSTPWGAALNFDGPNSGPVRAFFIANVCYWANEYHIDGLRLDATHALRDDSPTHILAEIAARVRASLPAERRFLLTAEDERNDANLVRGQGSGAGDQETIHAAHQPLTPDPRPLGYGLDALWADDFHHQLRVAFAGDRQGYYADYSGSSADLATTLRQGWFYTGQHSPVLDQPRGTPADDIAPERFIHCIQNHDQIGNRALGERLNHDIAPDAYRAATTLLLLSPYTPMLFMGQEWAAATPFLFFTDHHAELGRLVTEGRRAEFAYFSAFASADVPDPQALDTFLRSKLRWQERDQPQHAGVLRLYRNLLALRRRTPALRERSRASFAVVPLGEQTLALRRSSGAAGDVLLIVNLRGALRLDLRAHAETSAPAGQRWRPLLDSEALIYGGRGDTRFVADDAAQPILELSGAGALLLAAERAPD